MRRASTIAILALLVSLPAAPSVERLRAHVGFLADEALEGRMTGSAGEVAAIDYLESRLKELGARPLPGRDGFRHGFDFTAGMNDGGTTLAVAGEAPVTWGEGAVRALSFSDTATVSGPAVFAGYGLFVPESESGYSYDSYAGLDVKDKIVVVLRYFPEDAEDEQRVTLARYAGLRYKAMRARELGAKGLVVVTGPNSPNAGELIPMTFDTALSGSGIVAASVTGEVGERLLAAVEGTTLASAQAALDSGNPHATGFDLPGLTLTLDARVERETRRAHNVVGLLPATVDDPSDRVLLLGAHMDHLGRGSGGNSLARSDEKDRIHPGADDNASGVAAVLEIAHELTGVERRHPVVLAFWSGEEMGLLGSSRFIDDGIIDPKRIEAYLNFDMVGRMSDNRLSLQAAGSSAVWPGLVERLNVSAGFDVSLQDDPYLPTDAMELYTAEVPTLNFFTGSHEDYHRPTDTADKINYDDLERIVEFATRLTRRLDALEEPPAWVRVEPKSEQGAGRTGLRAFTGTIPDYTTEVEGLLLSGVVSGGPAETAGLQGGDVIVRFGSQTIANIYDYTFALEVAKVGEPVEVEVIRDGERMTLTLTPTARD